MSKLVTFATNYYESSAPNSKLVTSCLNYADGSKAACYDYGSDPNKTYFKDPITHFAGGNVAGIKYYTQPNNENVKKFVGIGYASDIKVECPLGTLLTEYDTINNIPMCDYDLNAKNCVSQGLVLSNDNVLDNKSIDLLATCSNDIDLSYCPEIATMKTREELEVLANKLESELGQEYSSNTKLQEVTLAKGIEIMGRKMIPSLVLKNEFPELYKKIMLLFYLKKYSDRTNKGGMPLNFGYNTIPICANYVKQVEPVITEEIPQKEDEKADEQADETAYENKNTESNTENKNTDSTEVKTLNLRVLYFLLLVIVVLVLINKYVLIKNSAVQNKNFA
jgi:hypothetical protein